MLLSTAKRRVRMSMIVLMTCFSYFVDWNALAQNASPKKHHNETFVVMFRDVNNNLYHTLIWHIPTLMRVATQHTLHPNYSTLIFVDGMGGGPFLELYSLLLGYKRVVVKSESPDDSGLMCASGKTDWSDEQIFHGGNVPCVLIPHSFSPMAQVHGVPRTESELRSYVAEIYSLRVLLREKLCFGATDRTSQIVFIDRDSGSRGISNKEDVIQALSTFHREVVVARLETLSLTEQADMFCNAGVIVGMHGAGFTWLLAASSGSSIIEIFPYGWADPCYRNIARVAGVTYFAVQNTKKEYHNESEHIGRSGMTRLDTEWLHEPLRAALLVSANSGAHFSPPCKDVSILKTPVPTGFPCDYIFNRITGEKIFVEHSA